MFYIGSSNAQGNFDEIFYVLDGESEVDRRWGCCHGGRLRRGGRGFGRR